MEKQPPIDFVIIWVDGNDKIWQQERKQYLCGSEEEAQGESCTIRYRDWDNLRYWFRAVEKYAPWVNQVHFVTCGHVPEWLNLDAPKLHFVKHSDYIPEEWLPTFSSHPIELNLHRIKGLSEQFVYFNDDFFLTAPVRPEDFFVNGLPCDSVEETPMSFSVRTVTNQVQINDILFADQHFGRKACRKQHWRKWYSLSSPHVVLKNAIMGLLTDEHFYGLNIHHLPQAYLKSTFEAVWNADPELLAETSSHKFRDPRDVNQFVFKYWQLLTGSFHPYNKRKFGKFFLVDMELSDICHAISSRQYKALCLNDTPIENFEHTKQAINAAFEAALPEKSSFEL